MPNIHIQNIQIKQDYIVGAGQGDFVCSADVTGTYDRSHVKAEVISPDGDVVFSEQVNCLQRFLIQGKIDNILP